MNKGSSFPKTNHRQGKTWKIIFVAVRPYLNEAQQIGDSINMFIGEYTHSVDDKKRLSVPAKFRKELGKKAVVTHGLNNCLVIYPMPKWKKIAEKLSNFSEGQSDSRGFRRFMLAGAVEVDVDTIGRVLIPDFLKQYANLKDKVVLTGVYDRVEVWDEAAWKTYKAQMAADADRMAEKLGESGVF